ncbi:MAG TPA: prolyl oligopeptidase family serine peptidase [Polyangiaceae bacterium]|nr:prolyl oligopeptidase family serine peptidase [Polyangiaceae bacterium]
MSEPSLSRVSYASRATGAERDYFVYLPRGYAERREPWPLLLFLHGNGERGDAKADLDFLLVNGPLYEAWVQKRDLPFIIVAPQLPMYGQDELADYLRDRPRERIPQRLAAGTPERPPNHATRGPMRGVASNAALPDGIEGPPMGWNKLEHDLLGIVEQVAASHRVDRRRLYLTGLSYGAFGSWYLASQHPGRFAAMVAVVGYPHPDHAPAIAKAGTPVWCFAGGRDEAVPLEYFYPGLNRLEQLGHRRLRFSIEADMGHDVWARVYAGRDIYDWLLEHQL